MRLTKLAHAGVKLAKDGATLVIDPGTFGSGTQALAEADAVHSPFPTSTCRRCLSRCALRG